MRPRIKHGRSRRGKKQKSENRDERTWGYREYPNPSKIVQYVRKSGENQNLKRAHRSTEPAHSVKMCVTKAAESRGKETAQQGITVGSTEPPWGAKVPARISERNLRKGESPLVSHGCIHELEEGQPKAEMHEVGWQ